MNVGFLLIPWTGDRVDEKFLLVVLVIQAAQSRGTFMVGVRRARVPSRGDPRVTSIVTSIAA